MGDLMLSPCALRKVTKDSHVSCPLVCNWPVLLHKPSRMHNPRQLMSAGLFARFSSLMLNYLTEDLVPGDRVVLKAPAMIPAEQWTLQRCWLSQLEVYKNHISCYTDMGDGMKPMVGVDYPRNWKHLQTDNRSKSVLDSPLIFMKSSANNPNLFCIAAMFGR